MGAYRDVVGAGDEVVKAEFAAILGDSLALHGGIGRLHDYPGGRDACTAGVLHGAAERSARVLGVRLRPENGCGEREE